MNYSINFEPSSRELLILALGIVIGASAIVHNFQDRSALPPKGEVEMYVEEDFLRRTNLSRPEVELGGSRYPSFYKGNISNEYGEIQVYVSKSGTIVIPRSNIQELKFPENYTFRSRNQTIKEYIESR